MNRTFEQPIAVKSEQQPDTFVVCFMHDHLQEVTRIQCRVIESTLLGDEFVSEQTAEQLRLSASLYLSYAQQIDEKIKRKTKTSMGPN